MKRILPLFLLASALIAQPPAHDDAQTALISPDKIEWKDASMLPAGAKLAILEGDPAKEGMFVMRLKVPAGFHIPAHTHPTPERVTVLQGTMKLAMGDQ